MGETEILNGTQFQEERDRECECHVLADIRASPLSRMSRDFPPLTVHLPLLSVTASVLGHRL